MTARYANGRLQISLIYDRMIFIVVSHSHFVWCHDGISGTHMHNFYHAMHARLYQLKSYLCSQLWFPTVQDVLHADWQDVWHSPQPPFFMLFFSVLALSVFTCFISMSSFIFLVYKVLQIISYVARLCKHFNLPCFSQIPAFLELFTGRHFWNRKCRKKTWWQQEFAVLRCEATANSVTGHVCVNSNACL